MQVVVDPIKLEEKEMYADDDARSSVFKPEGTVGIKYRREKQLETMARLNVTYGQLFAQSKEKNLNNETLEVSRSALRFTDLHDRAGCMEVKGAIRMVL